MKRLLTLGLFVLFSLTSWSQVTVTNVDSLLVVLNEIKEDTAKVTLYQKIASHYNVTHIDSAKVFAEDGVTLARKLQYDRGLWMNLNVLANYHERKSQYDSAMVYYEDAKAIIDANTDTKGVAVVYNNIATVHIRRGEYEKALPMLFDALEAEEALKNRNGVAQAYNNIGIVYYYSRDFEKTTQYLTQALEIQQELGNMDGLINGYNNVGAIHIYRKAYDEAIASYEKGLDISRQLNDKKQEASQLSNIALAYSEKQDFTTAEAFFKESIAIKESIEDYNGIAISYVSFGAMYKDQGDLTTAKQYVQDGIELAKQYNVKLPRRTGYSEMAAILEKEGNYKGSNEYLNKWIQLNDSILSEDNARIIAEAETKYESEKKERALAETRADLAESTLKIRKKNTMIFGGFGLAVVFGLLGYLVYNQQLIKNRQLQKEGELKAALAKIETQNKLQEQRLRISRDLHDNIGSQLTFIISSVDSLKFKLKNADELVATKLGSISDFTGQTIYELRDTIWAMNKGTISVEDLQSRISNFIEKLGASNEGIDFSFQISDALSPDTTYSSVDGMNMYRIIQEAVNNALKYASPKNVEVFVGNITDESFLVVKDDGDGFDEANVELGNGLNNIRKRARDLNANATIESAPGKGTTVSIKRTSE